MYVCSLDFLVTREVHRSGNLSWQSMQSKKSVILVTLLISDLFEMSFSLSLSFFFCFFFKISLSGVFVGLCPSQSPCLSSPAVSVPKKLEGGESELRRKHTNPPHAVHWKWSVSCDPKSQKGSLCLHLCYISASLLQNTKSSGFFLFFILHSSTSSLCVCVCVCGEKQVIWAFHQKISDVFWSCRCFFSKVEGAESHDFLWVLKYLTACVCLCVCANVWVFVQYARMWVHVYEMKSRSGGRTDRQTVTEMWWSRGADCWLPLLGPAESWESIDPWAKRAWRDRSRGRRGGGGSSIRRERERWREKGGKEREKALVKSEKTGKTAVLKVEGEKNFDSQHFIDLISTPSK